MGGRGSLGSLVFLECVESVVNMLQAVLRQFNYTCKKRSALDGHMSKSKSLSPNSWQIGICVKISQAAEFNCASHTEWIQDKLLEILLSRFPVELPDIVIL